MALLGGKTKDPIDVIERELSDLVARRDVVEQKFDQAHAALAAAIDVRRTSLLDADLSDEEACRRRDQLCRDTRDRVEVIGDALSAIGAKIADAESRLLAARDAAERAELAATVRNLADTLHDAALALAQAGDKAIAAMDAVVARVANLAPDFAPQARMLIKELPEALDHLVGEAYQFALQTTSGDVPLHHAPPQQPEPEPPAPPVERMRIYCRSPLRWAEGAQVICAAQYSFADPPRDVAERALSRDLASLPDAEITRLTIESFGASHAVTSPDLCISLDTLDRPPAAEETRRLNSRNVLVRREPC